MSISSKKVFFVNSVNNPYTEFMLGGARVTLQHAKLLHEFGFDVYVVYGAGRFEVARSRFTGRVKYPESFDRKLISYRQFCKSIDISKDFVVLPGRFLESLDKIPGNNKVLFSQGAFITLDATFEASQVNDLWQTPALKALICVSKGNAVLLSEASGSRVPTYVVSNAMEPIVIPKGTKSNLIAYPSLNRAEKNPLDTKALMQLIFTKLRKQHGVIPNGIDFIELNGFTHEALLKKLEETKVLVFLGTTEGLPLLLLEAMARGVICVGYNRRPMSDLLHDSCCFELDSLQAIAGKVQWIIENYDKCAHLLEWNESVLAHYTKEKQRDELLNTWNSIISRDG